jgi:hypothetical protein
MEWFSWINYGNITKHVDKRKKSHMYLDKKSWKVGNCFVIYNKALPHICNLYVMSESFATSLSRDIQRCRLQNCLISSIYLKYLVAWKSPFPHQGCSTFTGLQGEGGETIEQLIDISTPLGNQTSILSRRLSIVEKTVSRVRFRNFLAKFAKSYLAERQSKHSS